MRDTSVPTAKPSLRLSFDAFELDEADARLKRAGTAVPLPPKPFAVLCALARAPGTLVTKNALLDIVWGHRFVSESVLKSTMSELRAALDDDPKRPRYIETVSRRGYRFIAPISAPAAPAIAAPAATWMVGRADALEELHAAWRLAAQGRRQMVWIAGEAGVGKTTLIERFMAEAGEEHCVHGQCVEQYGAGEPYLPLLEALAELCRRDAAAGELVRSVAPTWLLQLPWLAKAGETDALRRELAGAGQTRMLREMAELLERYTETRPLLLVTEDLHWSDLATVQLIDYVARRRSAARFLWLASFRATEMIAANHPFRAVRQELRLHDLAQEIVLDAFSEEEIAQYLAERAPTLAGDEAFVRALHARTDGLPLLVAEVVKEAAARGSSPGSLAVPTSLTGIIERYIRELAPDERALLEAASVCGVEFRLATVASVLARDAAALAESCAELARRQRWLSDADGEYAFRHPLYREALYQRIAPLVRVALHRKVAAALERERAAGLRMSAAEIAFHFEQGEDARAALGYYAEAAEWALMHSSPAETIRLTERGLSLLASLAVTSERTTLEITLAALQGAAAVQFAGISSLEAKHAYQRAESLLGDAPRHPLRGLFLHALSVVLWVRGELDEAEGVAARAEALSDSSGDPAIRLSACLGHGAVAHIRGRARVARDWLEKALTAGEELDKASPTVLAAADPTVIALGFLALQLANLGLVEQARTRVREAHARARTLRTPGPQAGALWFEAFLEVRLGNAERAAEAASQMLALSEEYAMMPHVRAVALWLRGWAQARRGDPEAGYRLIQEGHEQGVVFGLRALSSEAHAYGAEALAAAGNWLAARRELEEAMRLADAIGERQYRTQLLLLDARIAEGLGEADRGRESLRQALAEARVQESPWLELLALCALCERNDAGRGDMSALARIVEQLGEAAGTPQIARARTLLRRKARGEKRKAG